MANMTRETIIDCDIHCTVPSIRALFPYLSDYWIETIEQDRLQRATDNYYPSGAALSARPAPRRRAAPAASDLELVRSQALDRQNVELAILNCAYAVDGIRNPYGRHRERRQRLADRRVAGQGAAPARLDRGHAAVPGPRRQGDRSGRRAPGLRPGLPAGRSERPYGNRRYFPIFEAAVRHRSWPGSSSAARPASRRPPAAGRPITLRKRSGCRTSSSPNSPA